MGTKIGASLLGVGWESDDVTDRGESDGLVDEAKDAVGDGVCTTGTKLPVSGVASKSNVSDDGEIFVVELEVGVHVFEVEIHELEVEIHVGLENIVVGVAIVVAVVDGEVFIVKYFCASLQNIFIHIRGIRGLLITYLVMRLHTRDNLTPRRQDAN